MQARLQSPTDVWSKLWCSFFWHIINTLQQSSGLVSVSEGCGPRGIGVMSKTLEWKFTFPWIFCPGIPAQVDGGATWRPASLSTSWLLLWASAPGRWVPLLHMWRALTEASCGTSSQLQTQLGGTGGTAAQASAWAACLSLSCNPWACFLTMGGFPSSGLAWANPVPFWEGAIQGTFCHSSSESPVIWTHLGLLGLVSLLILSGRLYLGPTAGLIFWKIAF